MTPETYIETVLPKMEGWCTLQKANRILELVEEYKPSLYVEIGVFAGRSLFVVALSQRGLSVGIDPWSASDSATGFTDANRDWWSNLDHDGIYNACRRTLATLELYKTCHLIRATSVAALPLVSRISPIDMLHIDGNHSEASSCFDVQNYVPLVSPGGIILFDDTDWSHTKRAQRLLATYADTLDPVGTCGIYRKRTLPTGKQTPTVQNDGGAQ